MKRINKRRVVLVLVILLFMTIFQCRYQNYKYKIYSDYAEIIRYKGTDKNVVIPDRIWGKKVTVLGQSAFLENDNIESVKLPKYLEIIGANAFYACKNLETVELGENVQIIDMIAFKSCSNLKNVRLNEGLRQIGEQAFCNTEQLETILIPASVERIEKSAFLDANLKEVIIEGEKTYVGEWAFGNTPWEKNLADEFVICGDHVLIDYNGTDEIVQIPDGVKYIYCSFLDNEGIKEIYIPNTAIAIVDGLFFEQSDVSAHIPSSVKEIENEIYTTDDSTMTIVTTEGSEAERFAKENGFNVEIVDEIVYPQEK